MFNLKVRKVVRLLTLPVLLVAGACAVIPEYRATWPPLEQADTKATVCPSVSGTHLQPGEIYCDDGKSLGKVCLFHVLAGGRPDGRDWNPYPPIRSSAHAEISTPEPQTIEVTSVLDGVRAGAFSQSWLTDDVYQTCGDRAVGHYFTCEKGFVRLASQYSLGSAIPEGINLPSDLLWLRHATDGSQMVLHRYDEAALVVVVPVGKTGTVWSRLAPIKPWLSRLSDNTAFCASSRSEPRPSWPAPDSNAYGATPRTSSVSA